MAISPIILTHLERDPEWIRQCEVHLIENQCSGYSHFFGYPGRGLKTRNMPGIQFLGDPHELRGRSLGQNLTHWHLWSALKMTKERNPGDKCYEIVEDDVHLLPDWTEVFYTVMDDMQHIDPDWQFINWAPCCVGSPETTEMTQMSDHVWRGWGQCLHFYTVRPTALDILMSTNNPFRGRIDQQMQLDTFPHLRSYCVLPRLAEQRDITNPPFMTDLPL